MAIPAFEVAADKYGRDTGSLEPSGGTLTIDVSSVAAGAFLPGDRDDIKTKLQIIRIAATKDVWIAFSDVPITADANDILFIAGTEQMKLPFGTGYVSAVTRDAAETGKVSVTVML